MNRTWNTIQNRTMFGPSEYCSSGYSAFPIRSSLPKTKITATSSGKTSCTGRLIWTNGSGMMRQDGFTTSCVACFTRTPGNGSRWALMFWPEDTRHADLQLPGVLRHPFLFTTTPDPKLFRILPLTLPKDIPIPLPASILDDICFLAYLNDDFALCESKERVRDNIIGPISRWEKRWAGFLNHWSHKEELLQWEDIPKKAGKTVREHSAQRLPSAHGRALREIHLSPNVSSDIL
jgi:hypothetical protein